MVGRLEAADSCSDNVAAKDKNRIHLGILLTNNETKELMLVLSNKLRQLQIAWLRD